MPCPKTVAAPQNSRSTPTDVLIIGAGPAGLSTAQSLSRLLHTCIIFSTSTFRNDRSHHMHGVPTWEHRSPADYRSAVKADILSHYSDTVSFQDVGIAKLEKTTREDGMSLFKAVDYEGKEWWGRKVVLATGWKDLMVNIEGYEECWGVSIFHCLFCHGYESRFSPTAGILAIGDLASPFHSLFVSRFANRLAERITIYTHGNAAATKEIQETLDALKPESKTARNVTINELKIVKFVRVEGGEKSDVEVHLEDGSVKVEGFLAHAPKGVVNGPFVEQLGLEVTANGKIVANAPFNETRVGGVFCAGDATLMMAAVMPAVASGGAVAAGLAAQLGAED